MTVEVIHCIRKNAADIVCVEGPCVCVPGGRVFVHLYPFTYFTDVFFFLLVQIHIWSEMVVHFEKEG